MIQLKHCEDVTMLENKWISSYYKVWFLNVNEYRIPFTFFSTGIPCVNSF